MTHKVPTFGSRIQVYRGHAKKTSGGLTKTDLMMNKHGRVVSKAKHFTAKKEQRLLKHGYGTQKGKFGFVKVGSKSRKSHSKSKKMRGGMIPLSPSDLGADGISGAGITDFGMGSTDVQFRAGMSGGRRHKMRGGSGMSPLSPQGNANWSGDGISGAGVTDFGSSSDSVQFRAGMSGGRGMSAHRAQSLALGKAKARSMGMGRAKALALAKSGGEAMLVGGNMRGGTGNRGALGLGSDALQIKAGNAS